ncbi:hypothetical protein C8J57DRAFT_374309 [Mycena rebaudengoi]|nr:hypothetical protein C8J57DRAFT_374309 [Mycena rebaudengoi]
MWLKRATLVCNYLFAFFLLPSIQGRGSPPRKRLETGDNINSRNIGRMRILPGQTLLYHPRIKSFASERVSFTAASCDCCSIFDHFGARFSSRSEKRRCHLRIAYRYQKYFSIFYDQPEVTANLLLDLDASVPMKTRSPVLSSLPFR